MTKDELHNQLKTQDSLNVPQSDFISIYGNDDKRPMKHLNGRTWGRADVLAGIYNHSVTFDTETQEYRFIRKD